jgi:hypothetical protein
MAMNMYHTLKFERGGRDEQIQKRGLWSTKQNFGKKLKSVCIISFVENI